MPDSICAELPRVLVPWTARKLAVSRSRIRTELRRGNWRMIARGAVLTRPEAPGRVDWAELGLLVAGPSAALSGWDALRARGLGERNAPTDEVLVLSRRAGNRVLGRVRIRRTRRPYSVTTTSFENAAYPLTPVVAPARAVADTALDCRNLAAVRATVTAAVQRRACSVTDLVAELDGCPRQHSQLFRRALADAVAGARSAAEAAAARRLVRARVPPFELNVPIVDEYGTVIFVVDVLWRALRAALEVDSREHHFSEADWKATLDRHNHLTRYGLAVTHYPPSVISAGGGRWLAEVEDWLAVRAAELAVPTVTKPAIVAPSPGASPPPLVIRRTRPRTA